MYFITTKRMLEVCFSAHPNIQYRTPFFSSWERPVKGYPMKGKEFRRGRVGEEKDGDDT